MTIKSLVLSTMATFLCLVGGCGNEIDINESTNKKAASQAPTFCDVNGTVPHFEIKCRKEIESFLIDGMNFYGKSINLTGMINGKMRNLQLLRAGNHVTGSDKSGASSVSLQIVHTDGTKSSVMIQ
ncbi:MAG: hypothetical protein V4534_07885 [Myxococcota bacterium]